MNEAVHEAALVCVPSLWSAPAEGALIKSRAVARAVAVVRNDTALASELPDELVLKLSPDRQRLPGNWRMRCQRIPAVASQPSFGQDGRWNESQMGNLG